MRTEASTLNPPEACQVSMSSVTWALEQTVAVKVTEQTAPILASGVAPGPSRTDAEGSQLAEVARVAGKRVLSLRGLQDLGQADEAVIVHDATKGLVSQCAFADVLVAVFM